MKLSEYIRTAVNMGAMTDHTITEADVFAEARRTAPALRAGDRVTVHGPGSSMTRGEVRALGNLSGPLVVVIASDEDDEDRAAN